MSRKPRSAAKDNLSGYIRRYNDRCRNRWVLFGRYGFSIREQALDVASDRFMSIGECVLN